MKFGIPQIIYLALTFMSLGVNLANDGKLKPPDTYNFWTQLLVTAFIIAILYWGGFF